MIVVADDDVRSSLPARAGSILHSRIQSNVMQIEAEMCMDSVLLDSESGIGAGSV